MSEIKKCRCGRLYRDYFTSLQYECDKCTQRKEEALREQDRLDKRKDALRKLMRNG